MQNITTIREARDKLIEHSKIIEKNMYFHCFKYEIEMLINDFLKLEKKKVSCKITNLQISNRAKANSKKTYKKTTHYLSLQNPQ